MGTVIAVLAVAALFVAFALLRIQERKGCHGLLEDADQAGAGACPQGEEPRDGAGDGEKTLRPGA